MNKVNAQLARITNNPVGAIAGGIAGFYVAKKAAKLTNMWMVAGVTVVGIIGGAMVQSNMKAKAGAPTAATTK